VADETEGRTEQSARRKRADAQRNRETLLDAAAELFVTSGVQAPVRDIAAKAGVGTGTIYRHFPTRADLIVAVYRHQVEACVAAGPELLESCPSAFEALEQWIERFADFLVTKHGLATVFRPDNEEFGALHGYFLERLLPMCSMLLDAAGAAGEVRPGVTGYELMRGVGNLCAGSESDPDYDARRLVSLLMAGLREGRGFDRTASGA
jgi:AcrR family transcriptional regulator